LSGLRLKIKSKNVLDVDRRAVKDAIGRQIQHCVVRDVQRPVSAIAAGVKHRSPERAPAQEPKPNDNSYTMDGFHSFVPLVNSLCKVGTVLDAAAWRSNFLFV
jgi:hypothetical protein